MDRHLHFFEIDDGFLVFPLATIGRRHRLHKFGTGGPHRGRKPVAGNAGAHPPHPAACIADGSRRPALGRRTWGRGRTKAKGEEAAMQHHARQHTPAVAGGRRTGARRARRRGRRRRTRASGRRQRFSGGGGRTNRPFALCMGWSRWAGPGLVGRSTHRLNRALRAKPSRSC